MEDTRRFDPSMKNCPVCKKKFFVMYPGLWGYKRGSKPHNFTYYCSWKCLRASEKKGEEKHMGARRLLTDEQKNHAVWLAISGEDPRPYLTECGSKNANAAWSAIRTAVKENDPETFAKLPRVIGHKKRPKTVTFQGKEYEKAEIETPEGEYTPSLAECFKGMNDAAKDFFGACDELIASSGVKLDKEPEATDFVQEVPDEKNAEVPKKIAEEDPEDTVKTVKNPMQVVAIRSRVRPDCRWEVLADGDMVLCNGGFRFGLTAHQWKRFLEEVPEAMKQLGVEA